MSKKLLALLLALVMIVGSFTSVLAAEPTAEKKEEKKEAVEEKKEEVKTEEKKEEPAKTEEKTEEKAEEKKEEKKEEVKDEALLRAIEVLKKAGFISGYSKDSEDFKAEKNVTRAEFASMIVRVKGLEDSAKALATVPTGFKDVPTNLWANGYIAVAKQQGFINGYPNGTFQPNRQISYQDMATMLTIALGKAEVGTVYPAGYIVKAQQLGLFNNVKPLAYTDMATRGDVFKMVYNMITSKEFGERKIVKAIVLENNRVEKLAENEIVVEVIKLVQEANWVGANRDKRGDQHNYMLDKELNLDAEQLLGKVVDITVDKNDKIVEIKEDDTYKYVEGQITSVDSKKFGIDNTKYTALFDERYDMEDERIYRTYLNNKDYKYEDFARKYEKGAYDFARVTVKNGKVVFIDAYKFDDIAPVAEVKDGDVWFYDDVRDGRVIKAGKLADRVIAKTSKGYEVTERKAIVKDDVIHFYNDYKNAIVKKDAKIQAKLVKTHLDKYGDEFVVIEGKDNNDEYWLNYEPLFRAIYSYEGKQFNTIKGRVDLKPILGRNVKLLIALDGSVQYIDSDLAWSDGIQAIKHITSDGQVKFLPSKGDAFWAKEGRNTEYFDLEGSNNLRLHSFHLDDIVYLNAAEKEEIGQMGLVLSAEKYTAGLNWAKMDYRYITVGNENYRYFDNLHAYAITRDGLVQIADMDKFIADNKNNADLMAFVMTEDGLRARFKELEIEYYNFLTQATGIANIVVFKGAKSVTKTKVVYAEVTDKYNRTVRFKDANGVYYDVEIISGGLKDAQYVSGDIVELRITDATKDEDVKKGYVKQVVIKKDQPLVSIRDLKIRDAYDINDGTGSKEKYFDRDTQIFNRQLGDWAQVYYDEDDTNFVRVVRYFDGQKEQSTKNLLLGKITRPDQMILGSRKDGQTILDPSYFYITTRTEFYGAGRYYMGMGLNAFENFFNQYEGAMVKVEANRGEAMRVEVVKTVQEMKNAEDMETLKKIVAEIEDLGEQKYKSTETPKDELQTKVDAILAKYNGTGNRYSATITPKEMKLEVKVMDANNANIEATAVVPYKQNKDVTEDNKDDAKKVKELDDLLDRVALRMTNTSRVLGQAFDEAAAKAVLTKEINDLTFAKDQGIKVDSVIVKDQAAMTYTVKISVAGTTHTAEFVAVIK